MSNLRYTMGGVQSQLGFDSPYVGTKVVLYDQLPAVLRHALSRVLLRRVTGNDLRYIVEVNAYSGGKEVALCDLYTSKKREQSYG